MLIWQFFLWEMWFVLDRFVTTLALSASDCLILTCISALTIWRPINAYTVVGYLISIVLWKFTTTTATRWAIIEEWATLRHVSALRALTWWSINCIAVFGFILTVAVRVKVLGAIACQTACFIREKINTFIALCATIFCAFSTIRRAIDACLISATILSTSTRECTSIVSKKFVVSCTRSTNPSQISANITVWRAIDAWVRVINILCVRASGWSLAALVRHVVSLAWRAGTSKVWIEWERRCACWALASHQLTSYAVRS